MPSERLDMLFVCRDPAYFLEQSDISLAFPNKNCDDEWDVWLRVGLYEKTKREDEVSMFSAVVDADEVLLAFLLCPRSALKDAFTIIY